MIRLFRQNRQESLGQTTVLTYFLYAIGEIILVVIGILIALYIDNVNEEKKNEEKIKAILAEIQVDLGDDIRKTSELIKYYEQKDSLIKQVLTDTLTTEDYQGRTGIIYFNLITNFRDFRIHDNGFTNLMRNSDIIPSKFEPFLDELKQVYTNDKERIDSNLETIEEHVLEIVDLYAKQYPWFSDLFQGKITEEIIDYHLHDPYYKNELIRYRIIASGNLLPILRDFKQYAIVTYTSIAKELEPGKALPDFIGTPIVDVDEQILTTYAGQYQFQESVIATVTVEGDQLFIQLTNQPRFQVFPESTQKFINSTYGVEIEFNIDEQEEIKSFTLFQRGQEVEFLKLDI